MPPCACSGLRACVPNLRDDSCIHLVARLPEVDAAVRACLVSFEGFQQKFPGVHPRRLSCVALYAFTLGRVSEAVELWEDTIVVAEDNELEFETTLAQARLRTPEHPHARPANHSMRRH